MVATAKPAAPLSRKRRIVVWTLVVLATILALVSILTTWVNRQMLDNSAWNKATTQVIQDQKVQSALATLHDQPAVHERQRRPGALGSAAAEPQAVRPGPRRRARAAGHAGRGAAPAAAARAAVLHQGEHDRPPEARQRAREQDRLRHLDRQRRRHARRARDDRRDRDGARHPAERAREVAGDHRHDHADEVRPALGRAGRRPGRPRPECLAARRSCSPSTGLRSGSRAAPGARPCATRGSDSRSSGSSSSSSGPCSATTSSARSRPPGYQPATHHLYLIGTSILGQIGGATLLYGADRSAGSGVRRAYGARPSGCARGSLPC